MTFSIPLLAVPVLLVWTAPQDPFSVRFTSDRLVPKGATIAVGKAGSPGPGAKGYAPVRKGVAPGERVELPGAGPFDLYLLLKSGLPVRFAEKWSPPPGESEVKLGEKVGAVFVRGDDLPRASKVILTAERDPGPGEKGHVPVQEADDYRVNLLAPPGFYAVWVRPANGARPQKIADRIRVHAGKVAEVGE
jgi:hypothetical protein